jgi:hypothetical protein
MSGGSCDGSGSKYFTVDQHARTIRLKRQRDKDLGALCDVDGERLAQLIREGNALAVMTQELAGVIHAKYEDGRLYPGLVAGVRLPFNAAHNIVVTTWDYARQQDDLGEARTSGLGQTRRYRARKGVHHIARYTPGTTRRLKD